MKLNNYLFFALGAACWLIRGEGGLMVAIIFYKTSLWRTTLLETICFGTFVLSAHSLKIKLKLI